MDRVRTLVDELQTIPIDWQFHTLASGSDEVTRVLRRRHPELDETATSALAWLVSWWWR